MPLSIHEVIKRLKEPEPPDHFHFLLTCSYIIRNKKQDLISNGLPNSELGQCKWSKRSFKETEDKN